LGGTPPNRRAEDHCVPAPGVLASPPVNLDRLLALLERQEQNMLDYEPWMAAHQRMRKEADWYATVYQGLFRNPIFPAFPVARRRSIRPGLALFPTEERRQQTADREAEEPLFSGESAVRRFLILGDKVPARFYVLSFPG